MRKKLRNIAGKNLALVYETVKGVDSCVQYLRNTDCSMDLSPRVFLPFQCAAHLCAAHNRVQTSVDICVWVDDNVLVSVPEIFLFESLLWQLHGLGPCCAVSGPFCGLHGLQIHAGREAGFVHFHAYHSRLRNITDSEG